MDMASMRQYLDLKRQYQNDYDIRRESFRFEAEENTRQHRVEELSECLC